MQKNVLLKSEIKPENVINNLERKRNRKSQTCTFNIKSILENCEVLQTKNTTQRWALW